MASADGNLVEAPAVTQQETPALHAMFSRLADLNNAGSNSPLEQHVFSGSPLSSSVAFSENERLDFIDWAQIAELTASETGSSGVFFLRMKDERRFVVKASNGVVGELVAQTLALAMNIRVPSLRLVTAAQRQWDLMKLHMRKALAGRPAEILRLDKQLNRPFFLLMELVPEAQELAFPAEQMQPILDAATPEGCRHLRDIGLLVSLDVVCNNSDRLPALWHNTGNPGNIMWTKSGLIVGIDNSAVAIHEASPLHAAYLARLDAFLERLLADHTAETPEIARVRDVFRYHGMEPPLVLEMGIPLGYDIGVEGSIQIQRGVLEGFARFSEMGPEHLEGFLALVHRANQDYDWGDIWAAGMRDTRPSFFEAVVSRIRPHRPALLALLNDDPAARTTSRSPIWQNLLRPDQLSPEALILSP